MSLSICAPAFQGEPISGFDQGELCPCLSLPQPIQKSLSLVWSKDSCVPAYLCPSLSLVWMKESCVPGDPHPMGASGRHK